MPWAVLLIIAVCAIRIPVTDAAWLNACAIGAEKATVVTLWTRAILFVAAISAVSDTITSSDEGLTDTITAIKLVIGARNRAAIRLITPVSAIVYVITRRHTSSIVSARGLTVGTGATLTNRLLTSIGQWRWNPLTFEERTPNIWIWTLDVHSTFALCSHLNMLTGRLTFVRVGVPIDATDRRLNGWTLTRLTRAEHTALTRLALNVFETLITINLVGSIIAISLSIARLNRI